MIKPRRTREVRSAGAAIVDALQLRGITDDIRAQRVIADWSELVGAKIAARTRPLEVRDRALQVEVASSAWLHELSLLKSQLLTGLLERLGEPRLFDDLKFQLAGRRRADGSGTVRPAGRVSRAAPPAPRPATGAAREQIVREVAAVDDAELRELIARVRIEHDK
nr:DUF721 domain-containing protein [Kofleriaceae bacterium]